jgi:hypothetical protein
VRFELALIFCGNRICEVITATLGSLPLDQPQKSKPVTPYAVFLIIHSNPATTRRPQPGHCGRSADVNTRRAPCIPTEHVLRSPCSRSRQCPDSRNARRTAVPQRRVPRALPEWMRKPLQALAVAEDAPAGALTGRVGAGPNDPGLPRDEARLLITTAGPQPPKRQTSLYLGRRRRVTRWLLRVTKFSGRCCQRPDAKPSSSGSGLNRGSEMMGDRERRAVRGRPCEYQDRERDVAAVADEPDRPESVMARYRRGADLAGQRHA